MKNIAVVYITIVILVVLLAEVGIYIANNRIAESIRLKLISFPCPDYITIEDSVSVAGKVFGNGNGMQYTGAMLIQSAENEKCIDMYYNSVNPECEVKQLQSSTIGNAFYFKEITESKSYYVITLTFDIEGETIPDTLLYRILSDCDIRGH
ncbi:MAG: hypothetical protein IJR97_05355 [Clostridia bacterium]|nr:hypothetical protein [Clostridia bacterium]